MKKQLQAAAVAIAIAAPMTAVAGDVTVYGLLHLTVNSYDFDTNVTTMGGTDIVPVTGGYDGLAVESHSSRLGVKGTEDLGNGLAAFFQMEFTVRPTDNAVVNNNRNSFVGLSNSIGKVGLGRNDSPYKKSSSPLELFGDAVGDYNEIGFHDVRMQNQLFYYSPNWNGFSLGVGLGMPSNDNGAGGTNDGADGVEDVSVAAIYKNGPWFASLAREELSQEGQGQAANANGQDDEKWRLGLGWTANGFHVGFVYEDREVANGAEYDVWQLSGSYTFGNNVLKVAYADRENDRLANAVATNNDEQLWSIGLDHKLSKRTKVYAIYADHNDDAANSDWDALSLGVIHSF